MSLLSSCLFVVIWSLFVVTFSLCSHFVSLRLVWVFLVVLSLCLALCYRFVSLWGNCESFFGRFVSLFGHFASLLYHYMSLRVTFYRWRSGGAPDTPGSVPGRPVQFSIHMFVGKFAHIIIIIFHKAVLILPNSLCRCSHQVFLRTDCRQYSSWCHGASHMIRRWRDLISDTVYRTRSSGLIIPVVTPFVPCS